MEDLIADYQTLYRTIADRIYVLKKKLLTEELRTMERESLAARISVLYEERFEIVCAINEMRKHL